MVNKKFAIKQAQNIKSRFSTSNPFELCSYLKIDLFYKDLGDTRGLFLYYKRKKMIFINETLPSQLQKQVCAHELGHAILHYKDCKSFMDNLIYSPVDYREIEADIFASELLIDEVEFKEQLITYSVNQLSSIFCVEEKLVEYKIKAL